MRILLSVFAGTLALATIDSASAGQLAPAAAKKAPSSPKNTFTRGSALPKWAVPLLEIPATERKDPVVIRLAETQAWVGDNHAVLLNRAIQVNEQSVLGVIGQFGIDYFPAYQKLHLHRVAILRGGQVMDRTATVSTRLLERETRIDAGMYGGAVTLQLLLDDVRVGDTLWTTYSMEGSNPVFGKQWSGDFSWDTGLPLERRSLTVFHPQGRPLYWRQLGDFQGAPLTPVISRQGEIEALRFEQRSLEAVESEESIPSEYQPGRSLQMSEHRDWNSVAVWASSLFPPAPASTALQAVAAQLRKEATPAAQAGAALRWVQDEIRYFSVSVGENSHRPQAPDTVLKLRYGDCKDKSYLLVSLLNQLGIRARLVLLNAQAPKAMTKIIASPSWFDHVIVQMQLDGRDYYVDPTANGQKLPLDKLTTVFAGASGLLVDPATQGLTLLPERSDVGPEYEHLDRITIGSFDGDAVLEARETYRGGYAEAMRAGIPKLSSVEFSKSMLERYESLYPGVTLIEPPRVEDDREANVFAMLGRYKLPKPVRQSDDGYVIDYDSHIVDGSLGLPKKIVRSYPLALPRGRYAARYRLQIQWPDGVRADQAPGVKSVDNPFFTARDELTLKGNVLDYMLDYRVKQAVVQAADVPELQAQSKLLAPYISATFRINKEIVSKPEVVAMSLSMRELDAMQVVADVHALVQTVDAAKATPADLDKACDVLLSAYRLRDLLESDVEGTLRQLEQSLKKEKVPGGTLCLARLSFAQGNFAESVASYQSAALKDDSPYRRDLAWAQAYAGDGAEAMATMAAYRATRAVAGSNISAGLVLADEIALAQRAGKPVPDELVRLARDIPDGIWPRPLLAMQLGVLSSDALLKLIATFPGDQRDLALNDAWFYIGQQRLLANDTLAARRAFLWYGVDGLRSSPLYGQAERELDRLMPDDENHHLGNAAFNRGDFATAIVKWRASAEAGCAASQHEMGMLYEAGKYIPQDYQQAKHWFELAAGNGSQGGMNSLGYMYDNGKGLPVDLVMAAKWYAKAAELGSRHASFNLGLAYEYGDGVEKDMDKAIFHYREGAERNHAGAQAKLAAFYMRSNIKLNEPKALRWAKRSAMRENEDGILALANIYDDGLGVTEDKTKAFSLYQLLESKGNARGRLRVAFMYERGLGVTQDLGMAFKLYTQLADAGDGYGSLYLGRMYRDGKGAERNLPKAIALLQQAGEDKGKAAYIELRKAAYWDLVDIYLYEKDMPVDEVRARDYLQAGADLGDSDAQSRLGAMYHFGKGGLDKNFTVAASLYQKAADDGNLFAMNNLADLYETGRGVPQDYAKAFGLYRQAAQKGFATSLISLSSLYEKGLGVQLDPVLAYTYCKLAVYAGTRYSAEVCMPLSTKVNAEKVAAADAFALGWKQGSALPAPGSL
jgi:TPR repeat protein/transglutaminase-like putative cysteine protease